MRDLNTSELSNVYGAGGHGCAPTPPSCSSKGSQSKGSRSKGSSSKCEQSKGSKSKGSKGCH